MVLLAVYVLLALGVSFLCSVMEAVLLSVSPSYIARAVAEGQAHAQRLEAFKREIDRPLAAILSLNTIAHTVGAAGAGAQAAVVFGSAYLGVASAVLTFLILFFSEIIPKTLGALYWRSLAATVTRMLGLTIWSMWPLVKMSEWVTRLLARGQDKISVHREEFAAMADVGVREGVLREDESRMVRSLLRFGRLKARDVMTPRTVIVHLTADETVGQVLRERPDLRFSRIPVTDGGLDRILGFVLRVDLLEAAARDDMERLVGALVRPLLAIPDSMPLRELFDRLTSERTHLALVVDEYGGTGGLVTMEDVIETLLGLEIMDEADTVRDMQALARESWRRRAAEMGLSVGPEE